MKRIVLNTLSVVAVCLTLAQAMAAEEKGKSGNDEQIIKQLEQEWADALPKRDQAAIDRITSADWELTDPEGRLLAKAQADADLKSGPVKFETYKLDELKAGLLGDTADMHGVQTVQSGKNGHRATGL